MKKGFSLLLSLAVSVSGLSGLPGAKTEAADSRIQISGVADLKKIGKDAAYPMDGDYVLTGDIDLSSENWTPIGGATGPEYGLTSGERVFSGTFDGQGHTIEGLTISYDGSKSSLKTNQSGLFAMIGSESVTDYAEVKNLNFTNVNITHSLGGGDTIGALSGDADGYVKIDNIAVLNGEIAVNGNNGGDLIGAGGVVGQVRRNHSAVQMSNLYNAASVTVASNVNTSPVRCGGILGRIHQDALIGSLTSCLNVGKVTWKGGNGYAVNGCSSNTGAASNTEHITNCYYLEGTGNDFGASTRITESQLADQSVADALGADYWEVYNGRILPVISEGKVLTPIPSPVFAEGDSISSVTQNFTLPLTYTTEEGEESIAWTSSDIRVISINQGTAVVSGVMADTNVTLTARTASGRTKTFEVTVVSNLSLTLDQEYAKVGTAITASVANLPEGASFTYKWTVNGSTVSSTASYTPKTGDLNKFLTVTATLAGSQNAKLVKKIYCSKLPVVYIDTDDGYGITSKEVYKGAVMHIQGNDKYNAGNTTLYDGAISIRGRGNSTWNTGYSKLPYKIKLDSKTNLFGFGTSKHWALLANYMDESLLRNTTSYDLSGAMGMPYLKSAHVDVILNGVYAGNYQLVGNVRVEESRVNIYDWEDLAGDVAKAIGKKEGISGDARDALEDYLNEHMSWITSDTVTYQGKTYKISDYFTDIPKNADGRIQVSGGFLFELDEYYDEYSKFKTSSGQPIMFKSPEFVSTCSELYGYAKEYIQAVEDSVRGSDYYVNVTKKAGSSKASNFTEDFEGRQHYTDLVDMDSLVNYFILNEFYWNTETMKKSTYMYKDLEGKLHIGPVWDMDWTSNSQVSSGETNYPTRWMTTTRGANAQSEQWYRYLIGDPYFVTKAYECYQRNRQNFEDIVKTGGIIDQQQDYLAESAKTNYEAGYLMHHSDFTTESERLRSFLKSRLSWMDGQFTSVDKLLSSLGKYKGSSSVKVTADTSKGTETTYTASFTNSSAAKAGFYINGILMGTADVTNGKAVFTAEDTNLEKESGRLNVVQARGMDASGNLLSSGSLTAYTTFTKEIQADALTGAVTISGTMEEGSILTATLSDTNNSGTLSYQWYADGTAINGAVSDTYQLTAAEVGKRIKVSVSSTIETGAVESAETEAIREKEELKNDHLIINQVYGGGANDGTPVSHSFIELYNPTEQEISLNGYTLGYLSGGKNGAAAEEVRLSLDGSKSVPSHTSYLIRCEAQDDTTPELITYSITEYDQEWSQTIDNKRFRLILYKGEKKEDGVSVNEGAVEGEALPDGTISKQKAIRRKDFADTNENQADFEAVTYKKADTDEAAVQKNRPRSLSDGAWDGSTEPVPPVPPVPPKDEKLTGTLSIRGNAVAGAVLYADEATNNTGTLSCQWYADGTPIPEADGLFYVVDQTMEGKTISVTIASTVETGTISSQMNAPVRVKKAQTAHLIINQVYGCSTKDGAISHSFIELYNPTAEAVDLEGYSISYTSEDTAESLSLSGELPAYTSFLIRCAKGKEGSAIYTIGTADADWELAVSNKRYCVMLKKGEALVDALSVNEAEAEGTPLTDPEGDEIISKNKAVRRICFIDTDVNAEDFEVLNYSKLPEEIRTRVLPRSSADGIWGKELLPSETPDIKPDEKEEVQKKLEAAVSQAEAYTDESVYTKESWDSLQEALKEAKRVQADPDSTKEQIQEALDRLKEAVDGLRKGATPVETEKPEETEAKTDPPAETEVLAVPVVTSVKSVIRSGNSNVKIQITKVDKASEYRIYRKSGSKTALLGTTADGVYYDEKPVGGKAFYYAEAANGKTVSERSAGVGITLPKASARVTAKAVRSGKKRTVKLTWKRVKGAAKYMIFRSVKSGSGYKRIAVIKKGKTVTYTDKKVVKGKKYYYRVVAVKKKLYSPSKKSKVVKVK